jgi:hypothetical protein
VQNIFDLNGEQDDNNLIADNKNGLNDTMLHENDGIYDDLHQRDKMAMKISKKTKKKLFKK